LSLLKAVLEKQVTDQEFLVSRQKYNVDVGDLAKKAE